MDGASFQSSLLAMPLAALAGALVNGLWGRRLPRGVVSWVGIGAAGLAFLYAVAAVWELWPLLGQRGHVEEVLYTWMSSGGDFGARVAFRLDPLSSVMVLVVTGVGFLIHLYSAGYMRGDPGYARYFAYLNLFLGAMLILVLADNLVLMFVGWEGVGLASYLLIGFWFEDEEKAHAGKKAFIVNRVGDFAFLVGMFLLLVGAGTLEIQSVNTWAAGSGGVYITAAALCLFVGACGKSAQLPLYVWLPDAMAGPTPVSALIHAATMVTAGVYMVGRMGGLFAAAPGALAVVGLVGAATAFYAATIALAANDVKKVLAYSTISQLGYMFMGMSLGVAGYALGIFHLTTHAFFKALLFLAAGSVIHGLSGVQDMREMGGLWRKMPLTFACFVVGGLALAGIPPMSGFYSKDAILHGAVAGGVHGSWWLWVVAVLGLAGAAVTAFYTTRMVALTFLGSPRSQAAHHPHECRGTMAIALAALLLLAAAGGAVLARLGGGFSHLLGPTWETLGGEEVAEHGPDILTWIVMALSVGLAAAGILLAWRFFVRRPGSAEQWVEARPARRRAYQVLAARYGVDEAYQRWVVEPTDSLSRVVRRWLDEGGIDAVVNDLASGALRLGARVAWLQRGAFSRYATYFALGAILILVGVLASVGRGG